MRKQSEMPPGRPELEKISFRLEIEVRAKLDRLISVTGLSQSEILRRLIESATAQAPRLEAHLDKVVSRERYSRAGIRQGAFAATARANGIGDDEQDDGDEQDDDSR